MYINWMLITFADEECANILILRLLFKPIE